MTANAWRLTAAIVLGIAAICLVIWYVQHATRQAYVARCAEDLGGEPFNSPEFCGELYAQSEGKAYSRREAYVFHCNEEGAGGRITSRQYCEALFARGGATR